MSIDTNSRWLSLSFSFFEAVRRQREIHFPPPKRGRKRKE
jgi:hypothetical protein